LGLFAIAMLFIGVEATAGIIHHPPPSIDLQYDLFTSIMFLVIGLVGGFAFLRWTRAGFRMATSKK